MLLALTGGAMVVTSCSSLPPPLPIGATPAPFSFTGNLQFRGEIALDGPYRDSVTLRHETCEQYVRGAAPATTLWVVPTPNNSESVDGHVVYFTAGVPTVAPSTGYRGPGTYTGQSAVVSVLTVDGASFVPGSAATVSISVGADGAGSMLFSGLVDFDTNAQESGQVRWTCTDG